MKEIKIGRNDSGQRIDKFLKKYLPGAPAGLIYKMLRKKTVKLNRGRAKPSQVLEEGDMIQLYIGDGTLKEFTSEVVISETGKDFSIVYQDENILVADKPAGLLSHSDRGQEETLIDQIVYYLVQKGEYNPEEEKSFRPALCNRLDRNTAGLVIAAKNFAALKDMNNMIKEKWVDKYYITIVAGRVDKEGDVGGYIVKDRETNKVRISDNPVEGGREIRAVFRPLQYSDKGYTLLEVQLITGRPHQIRAQLAYAGHPVAGDHKYGHQYVNNIFRKRYGLEHQLLYAGRIVFRNTTPLFQYMMTRELVHEPPPHYKKIIADIFEGREVFKQ